MNFSLNEVYNMELGQAEKNIQENYGKIKGKRIYLPKQDTIKLPIENSFEGLKVSQIIDINKSLLNNEAFEIDGNGIVISGYVTSEIPDYKAIIKVLINGKETEEFSLPSSFKTRKTDIYYNYDLPKNKNNVHLFWVNVTDKANIHLNKMIIYHNE